jgi:hypothetical protein
LKIVAVAQRLARGVQYTLDREVVGRASSKEIPFGFEAQAFFSTKRLRVRRCTEPRSLSEMRRAIVASSMLVGLVSCTAPSTETAEVLGESTAALTNGTVYQIHAPNLSNKCVDVSGGSGSNGANVQLWACNGSAAQNWIALDKGGGYWAFQHQGTNQCLNRDTSNNCSIPGNCNSSGGANAQQYDCQWSGSNEFQWSLDSGTGHIISRFDGKSLDVNGASSADGANIQTWTTNTSNAQVFNPPGAGGGSSNAVAWKDCNLSGAWNATIAPGSYTLSQLQALGVANDDMSSIQIPSGYEAALFADDNFTGTCAIAGSGSSCASCMVNCSPNMNDVVTSIKIQAAGTGCPSGGGGGGGSMKTVGYVVSWKPNIGTIQYNKLTHINYAFTIPDNVGNLTRNPENPAWLQTVVSNAHANGGKVLISVGGWLPDSPNPASFASIAGNAGYRGTFRNNLINLVNAYGLDGVDIDWEYPCPGGNGGNYATLMSELAGDMHSRGKLLTSAVAAFGANADCVGTSVFNSVDYLNLMVYDIRDPNHSDYADAVNSINYWKGKGLPASKAVLGLPFYSHPSWTDYATLVGQNSANACRDNDGVNYWNGLPTIRAKSSFARSNAGGVMMWEASQDVLGANSETTAMYEAVNGLARSGNCP